MSELAERFEFRVSWEPFFLRPNTPAEGMPKPANFSDPTNPRVQYLKQAGQQVGIDFAHKAHITPNTLKSHALIEFAKQKGGEAAQDKVAERIFEAYFAKGEVLDEKSLLEIVKAAGLDQNEAKSFMANEEVAEDIKVKARSWSEKGVTGVPFFYMNGHRMFSGAQDVETFKRMIEMASEKFPLSAPSKS